MSLLANLLIYLSFSTQAWSQALDEFPFKKEEVNACLEASDRVGYYLACGQSSERITSAECRRMREERFRAPPRLDKHGLRDNSRARDVSYTALEASKLIASDGSEKVYRQAIWNTAKAVDKKLLVASLGAWAAEIGSWYLIGTGRVLLGGLANLGGWSISAATSALLVKDVSKAANENLVKAYWHVKNCFEGDDAFALGEAQIKACMEQSLPHQGVVGVFSQLVSSKREGALVREHLKALATEGYSWELPSAQFRVACGIIQGMNELMTAGEAAPLSCDKGSGLIDINGKKFRQTMKLEAGELSEWALDSVEPFAEVTEGLISKTKVKKTAHINLHRSPLSPSDKTRVDLGEAFTKQAVLLAPRLMELKDCGGLKNKIRTPSPGSSDADEDEEDTGTSAR